VNAVTEVAAGAFSAWADAARAAQLGDGDASVPCAGCTACCRSSFFVHIGPDETEALRRIPPALLVRAPGLPPGYKVLGYDERGHCPMLVDDRCSIYEHRPMTCRKFDCRVLSAAGLDPDGPGQEALTERVLAWRFDVRAQRDRVARDAVRAAVAYLDAHPECFEPGRNPVNAVQRSVTALAVYELFVGADGEVTEPEADAVTAALAHIDE
jgi:Fe-S-cluster containining protein